MGRKILYQMARLMGASVACGALSFAAGLGFGMGQRLTSGWFF